MKRIYKQAVVTGLFVGALALSGVALATQVNTDHQEGVTICHRTNDVKKPYVKITVAESAIDGEGKNDHTHHTGPIATSQEKAQELKDSKTKWGDIIPNKLNWTTEGQEILRNDCEVPDKEPVPEPTPTPVPTPAPTPVVPPTTSTVLPNTGAQG